MRTLSNHAAAAKMIRKELKATFPDIKFNVISETYAGGNSVIVYCDHDVDKKKINEIIKKYQYGSFDAMTDCYEITNRRDDIPQVQYVMFKLR